MKAHQNNPSFERDAMFMDTDWMSLRNEAKEQWPFYDDVEAGVTDFTNLTFLEELESVNRVLEMVH